MVELFENEFIPTRVRIESAKFAFEGARAELQYIQQTSMTKAQFTARLKVLIDSLNKSNYYLNMLEADLLRID